MIKSIKQQYIDLKEGKMTQQNFMRNLRMTMPQYITNVTSYNDSIKILKNKGILTEADIKITSELAKGIKVEMEHTSDPEVAKKIAMDHLAEDPQYYTKLATIEPEHSGDPTLTGHMAKLARDLQKGLRENENNITNFKVKHGSEGPSHDPYGYTEYSFTKDGNSYIVHIGLVQYIKINGKSIQAANVGLYDNEEQFIKKYTGVDYQTLYDLEEKNYINYDEDPMGHPSIYMENIQKERKKYKALKEGAGIFTDLNQAKKEAQRMSDDEGGVAKHVDDNGDGTYSISDWYDADSTVASFGLGLDENQTEKYDNTTKKIDQSELSFLKKLYAGTPTDKIKKMIDNLEQKLKLQESKLTISGIDRAIKMLKSELKNNNVAFETDGYRVKVEDSPKVRMAVRMVKERVGMQSIKLSESVRLKEAKDEKGKWTNANGKSMYDQFKEIDNLNAQEVLIGLDWEMEKNPELSKKDAVKTVIKNLKKNPIYYTMTDLAGKEGAEAEYLGGKSANAEARHMQPYAADKVVDKKMGMQPVKGIEKPKKDADARKETNKIEKGVEELTFIAKTVRGVQKMEGTGETMKKIAMKEAVDKALAKERLKEMIRQELKEIKK